MKNIQQIAFQKALHTIVDWGFKDYDFESENMNGFYTVSHSRQEWGNSSYIYVYHNDNVYKLRVSDHGCGLNRLRSEYHSVEELELALFPDRFEAITTRSYETVIIECGENELTNYENRGLQVHGFRLSAKGNKVYSISFERYTDSVKYVKK